MGAPAVDMRREAGVVLAAFAADAITAAVIQQVASFHWPGATVIEGGLQAASTWLASKRAPDLLVIDLGASETPLEDLMSLADSCDPATQVVALGTVNDLGLYKQFVAAGVADYLVKPVSADELETALLAAAFRDSAAGASQAAPAPTGKVVVTIGARGGVGATTIATNGAWLLAEEQGQKTVLVDLDLQFGTSALSFDLVPAGGMIETLRNPDRVDSLFMASALVPKTPHLSVLAAEEDIARDIGFNEAGVARLIAELRNSFAWVWIDLPRTLCHANARLIAEAAHVFIVADPSLASMRDTMRIANFCAAQGGEGEVSVVLNRIGAIKGLPPAQFSRGVPCPVRARIVEDPKVSQAATAGKPVADQAARSKAVAAMRDIVRDLAPSQTRKRGLFRRRESAEASA